MNTGDVDVALAWGDWLERNAASVKPGKVRIDLVFSGYYGLPEQPLSE
jgi:hypothetical protein